jgi:hypothetical protein
MGYNMEENGEKQIYKQRVPNKTLAVIDISEMLLLANREPTS